MIFHDHPSAPTRKRDEVRTLQAWDRYAASGGHTTRNESGRHKQLARRCAREIRVHPRSLLFSGHPRYPEPARRLAIDAAVLLYRRQRRAAPTNTIAHRRIPFERTADFYRMVTR